MIALISAPSLPSVIDSRDVSRITRSFVLFSKRLCSLCGLVSLLVGFEWAVAELLDRLKVWVYRVVDCSCDTKH